LKLRAGIVGAGMISRVYLENARHFDSVEIVACADLIREKAEERAAEFGVKACEVDELLESPDIDLVINLTVPQAHAPINIKALEEGKHVYSEKAVGGHAGGREESAGARPQQGAQGGLRPGHLHGRRPPDLPESHQRRADRHADRRVGFPRQHRAGHFPPVAGLLFPARGRPAF